MKKITLILVVCFAIISCSDNDDTTNTSIYGTYKLVATYMDPGDGSGTYEPVSSNKTITFKEDGTVTSNGDLCTMTIDTDVASSGTFSLVDSTYTSSSCSNPEYAYPFEVSGNTVIVHFSCFEGCGFKYKKQ
uniref:lipocalin family protein n=1 Tax=Zhouia sp. PK063 TaxID=3373602 RepID=UPI0037DC77FD